MRRGVMRGCGGPCGGGGCGGSKNGSIKEAVNFYDCATMPLPPPSDIRLSPLAPSLSPPSMMPATEESFVSSYLFLLGSRHAYPLCLSVRTDSLLIRHPRRFDCELTKRRLGPLLGPKWTISRHGRRLGLQTRIAFSGDFKGATTFCG